MSKASHACSVRQVFSLEDACKNRGLRLTKSRLAVFDMIAASSSPVKAYDLLEKLKAVLENPKPMTVYRGLEFLQEHGFIHRIESLNAYIACHAGHVHEGSQYMMCDRCGKVSEVHLCSLPPALSQKVEVEGFSLSHWNLELHGLCKNCLL